MRIWSLHPQYLDAKGLVTLWREALLAKQVLQVKTKGYTNHPQLTRFKKVKNPVDSINHYLSFVLLVAQLRGYHFDTSKLTVTTGQIAYEMKHLLRKLKVRDPKRYRQLRSLKYFKQHPMFRIKKNGSIEDWEIIQTLIWQFTHSPSNSALNFL